MKKKPLKKYEKMTGKHPIIGTMAGESILRTDSWKKTGCNAFDAVRPTSQPMSFWTEQDVLLYLKQVRLPYPSVYGAIETDSKGVLHTTGEKRTGCMFCMYGIHLEKEPNKFQRMKVTHPLIYDYCMKDRDQGGLGLHRVLEIMKIKH